MTSRRPALDPKRPRDTRPPNRRHDPQPQPQPKPPPRPKNSHGLTVYRRVDGFVDYCGPAEAIVARAPAPNREVATRLAHLFGGPVEVGAA